LVAAQLEAIGVPLSQFSTKIDIAFAIGAIDGTTRQNLHALRGIRNEFSHPKKDIHFHLEEVRDLLKKFKSYDEQLISSLFVETK
jgi:DNA-binding MltR family transcriptional regulator